MDSTGVKKSRHCQRRDQQRGVAVIAALLVVSIAVIGVSGLLWRQQVQLRAVQNGVALSQARSLAYSAIDWARLILWEDQNLPGRAAYDHPGELWGVKLEETRIADGEGGDAREAFVAGSISDESGKLNLLDLVQNGRVNAEAIAQMKRLSEALQLDEALSEQLTKALLSTHEQPPLEEDEDPRPAEKFPAITLDDVARLAAIEPAYVERLRPHVTVLPKQNNQPFTVLNANSASAEALYARIPALSMAQAKELAAYRDRVPLRNLADIETTTRISGLTTQLRGVDVQSEYFRIQSRVRYERALILIEALVWRAPRGRGKPIILWEKE